MIFASMTKAQHARAAAKEARRICTGQSISAICDGDTCRAIAFRVHAGALQVRTMSGRGVFPRPWRTVDLSADGSPQIYDERGRQLG